MANGKSGAPKGNKNAAKGKDFYKKLLYELHVYEDKDLKIGRGEALKRIAKMLVADCLSDDFAVRHPAREQLANRIDGKAKEHIEGTFTHTVAHEMTDDELLDIARGGSPGNSEETQGTDESSELH